MKKGLKMNPNAAKTAGRIAAATAATEARGKCLKLYALIAGLKQKSPSNRLKADLYIVWNVSKNKNKLLFNL